MATHTSGGCVCYGIIFNYVAQTQLAKVVFLVFYVEQTKIAQDGANVTMSRPQINIYFQNQFTFITKRNRLRFFNMRKVDKPFGPNN